MSERPTNNCKLIFFRPFISYSNCISLLLLSIGDLPIRTDGLKPHLHLVTIGSHRSLAVETETTEATETDQATVIAGITEVVITEVTMAGGGRVQTMRLLSLGGARAAILPVRTGAESKSSSFTWTVAFSGILNPDLPLGINAAHDTCVH